MIRVLVTGSSGQLGSSLQKLADSYPNLSFHFTTKDEMDIRDSEAIDLIFDKKKFDYCINCAAYTNVESAEKFPDIAFAVNSHGVANLAIACKDKKVILIHISTDYVFDGEKKEGYRVDDIPNPINEYGRSKWAGEKNIQQIMERYHIIRTSWLYSYTGNNFYTKILDKAKNNEQLSVTDEQTGCPTHADNLARYVLDLIDGNEQRFGIHHYTDGEAMSWFEFAKKILIDNKLMDKVDLVASNTFPGLAKRPEWSILIP